MNNKIEVLQGIWSWTFSIIVVAFGFLLGIIFEKQLDLWIITSVSGALLAMVYIISAYKANKIRKSFAAEHPKYYAMKYEN